MKLYPLEEVLDGHFGKIGTPERDTFEKEVTDAVNAFRLGEVVRERRLDQNLTQEELGRRMGVKKSQISKLERGDDMSLRSMRRVFRALGVESATLDLGAAGKVTLWWRGGIGLIEAKPTSTPETLCVRACSIRAILPCARVLRTRWWCPCSLC